MMQGLCYCQKNKLFLPLMLIYLEIVDRYYIHFLEIGTDNDHVHFLVKAVSMYSIKKLVSQFSISLRFTFQMHNLQRVEKATSYL